MWAQPRPWEAFQGGVVSTSPPVPVPLGRARSSLCRWDGAAGGGGAEFLTMLAGTRVGRCGLASRLSVNTVRSAARVRRAAAGRPFLAVWPVRRRPRSVLGGRVGTWRLWSRHGVAAAISPALPCFTGMGVPAWLPWTRDWSKNEGAPVTQQMALTLYQSGTPEVVSPSGVAGCLLRRSPT
jgi:hypothetical protein